MKKIIENVFAIIKLCCYMAVGIMVVQIIWDLYTAQNVLDVRPLVIKAAANPENEELAKDILANMDVLASKVAWFKDLLKAIFGLAVPATFLHCAQLRKTKLEVMKLEKEAKEERKKSKPHLLLPPEFK